MPAIIWWFFTQALAYFGAALIAYTIISALSEPWPPIEASAIFLSSVLTIFGVLVTAASIYVPTKASHPPWKSSKYVAAPLVVAACLVALYFLIAQGSLPQALVNGFSLIGLSGGLQRALPTDPKLIATAAQTQQRNNER